MRQISLAHLTVLTLTPPEMIRMAARCGYDSAGLRLVSVTPESPGYPLDRDARMLRETRSALRDTGLHVHDIEFIRLTPEIDIASLEGFFAAGAELGARFAIAAPYDPDSGRLAASFAAFCALAAQYQMGGMLEFFPWTVVPDLMQANAILDAADAPNAGILVDALHFNRSGSTFAQLDAISPARFPYMHLCDSAAAHPGTTEGLLHHARAERLPPGEGAFDLTGLLAHLPENISVALEVPMENYTAQAGPEAVAQRAITAARVLLQNPQGG